MAGPDDDKGGKSCCTWPKVIIAVVLLGVVGVIIWQFAPIDEALDRVLPNYNNTEAPTSTPIDDETPPPTSAPTKVDTFNRCAPDATCCINGLDNICDLGVDDILYSMPHNAMATIEDGFNSFLANHVRPLEGALEEGYRAINIDVCNCGGGRLELCHGSCAFGTKDIGETFVNINQFLDNNPNEVLLMTLQFPSAGNTPVDIADFYAQMAAVNGITSKLYNHPSIEDEWPTLREAVSTNRRILFFHFNGPNCRDSACPPGMHYWFEYAAETEFDFPSTDAIANSAESCVVTRGGNLAREPASRTFFAVNNFITPSAQTGAMVTNAYAFANARLEDCKNEYNNLDVNVISVDYWTTGDMVRLQQDVNQARGEASTGTNTPPVRRTVRQRA